MVEQQLPDLQAGLSIGLSASTSEDQLRFGLTDTHFRMALGEVARGVLLAHGQLVYGGHLAEEGLTAFLAREVQRMGNRDRPFRAVVPYSVHRRMATADITRAVADLGLAGTYMFLDPDGQDLDPFVDRDEQPGEVEGEVERRALTAARTVITAVVDGQVLLGGRRSGYRGVMPGIVEEAVLTLRAGKPLFVAGGFGGSAGDVAVRLGLDPDGWLGLDPSGAALDELGDAARDAGWVATSNGLTVLENQQLAVTYRASEVASFVVVGLSRLRTP